MSGLSVSFLKILCMAVVGGGGLGGEETSARVYFGVSSCVLVCCCFSAELSRRRGLFRVKGKESEVEIEMIGLRGGGGGLEGEEEVRGERSGGGVGEQANIYWSIVNIIRLPLSTVFYTFFVTLAVFPGLVSLIKPYSGSIGSDWFSVLLGEGGGEERTRSEAMVCLDDF